MANETIELLKNYDPCKLKFPASLQRRHDGVPTRIERLADGSIQALTRQGETVKSIEHIKEAARPLLLVPGSKIIGELDDLSLPFKTISGQVRDTKAQHTNLKLYVFDASLQNNDQNFWINRYKEFQECLTVVLGVCGVRFIDFPVQMLASLTVHDAQMAELALEAMQQMIPGVEGAVLHQHSKPFQPGKRCWGTQRMKPQPTIDLKVVGFEEAISEDGTPKGMVGRINVDLNGTTIGIGPGKLSHIERVNIWNRAFANYGVGDICEVKYMPDPTYDALRQPTFQRWRPDKTEPDVYVR